MTRITISFLIFFLCISIFSFGQSVLKVEVQDAKTAEPVSFATIRFKGTQRGLIADYNGQFRVPARSIENISRLVITSIGYMRLEVDLKSLNTDKINILKMSPQTESLNEVIVKTTKPKRDLIKKVNRMLPSDLVRRAVLAIPKNVDDKTHSSIGYYRDYQIVDDEYFNLNEAIVEQFDSGIRTNKIYDTLNQSVLYSFKYNTDFKRNAHYRSEYDNRTKYIQNAEIIPYGGNELTLLNVHDAIRNFDVRVYSFVYRLVNEFLYNHEFKRGDISYIDNEPIITITFKSVSKKVSFKHKAEGVIKISIKDYSIHNFNYTVFDYNKLNPLFNIESEYRREGGKMHLNYITFNNRFVITDDNVFKESNVIYNKDQNRFYVNFNTELDEGTVHKRDFAIKYNGRKIFIEKLTIENPKRISLQVAEFDEELRELTYEEMPNLVFTIKNIYDKKNRKIYEGKKKVGYQFREFFVQEVLIGKELNKSLEYINKNLPLSEAAINIDPSKDIYIINTPLMERRMKKD